MIECPEIINHEYSCRFLAAVKTTGKYGGWITVYNRAYYLPDMFDYRIANDCVRSFWHALLPSQQKKIYTAYIALQLES